MSNQNIISAAIIAAALLAGCGGGGSSPEAFKDAGNSNQATPKTEVAMGSVLSGTAAYGAPVSAGTITVYDTKGAVVGAATTGAGGGFSVHLSPTDTGPFTLRVTKDEMVLYALHPLSTSGVVNITPLSDAVVSMVSPTGTGAGLLTALQSNTGGLTQAAIENKQAVVMASLAPVMTAVGISGNVFNTPFVANGQGQDKLLDSLTVTSNAVSANDGAKSANVQIAVKLAVDPVNPAIQPLAVNLTSSSSLADARIQGASLGTISVANLTPDSASTLYLDLLANLNTCYASPPNVRTDGNATVLSAACKKVFLNNDPTQYLNFGQRLGSSAQFPGMFTYTGAVEFKPMIKSYLVQDLNGTARGDGVGRAIVGLSLLNEQGNRENISLYVTKYTLDGTELLGLSGDRNKYPWAVVSHSQKREFPLKSDQSLDYVQSSYLMSVRDLIREGKSVINYVTVMTPTGKKVALASTLGGGSRDLALCRSTEVIVSGTSIIPKNVETSTYGADRPKYHCSGTSKSLTFAQRFVSATESRLPSDIKDVGILRPLDSAGQPYTPDSLTVANFLSVGKWQIVYTFMDGTTATQNTWSLARPMTTEELMGPNGPDAVMPRYTNGTISYLKALKSQPTNLLTPCYEGPSPSVSCDPSQSPVPSPATGGYLLTWSDSTVPMTHLWSSGRRNREDANVTWISGTNATAWDDQLPVRSTTRTAELKCSRQSLADAHCADGTAVSGLGNFHPRSWMTYSELWGRDAEQRSMMRSYNWYQPRKADGTDF